MKTNQERKIFMKRITAILLCLAVLLAGCSAGGAEDSAQAAETADETLAAAEETVSSEAKWADSGYVRIQLINDGADVSYPNDGDVEAGSVLVGGDIVYYEQGQDFTYGEGDETDAHSAEEAAENVVVTITQPGTYVLTGELHGQVAVDLGEEAETDPEAVVTLILDNVDITCTVAPAVIFYSVYECGSTDAETATYQVDTSAAGANVILADGSVNNISGSYVARIYEPDSVVLSEDGTEVAEAKKLHKYDGAFYSKMSMNIDGNDGILNITAENEGLDSELHLTVNGGIININSGNDGINTNEDGVSVTTINGGKVTITVDPAAEEGDGIDSNGWLVVNGGTVNASACPTYGDMGIDADMGIYLNGGTVLATGNMLDPISEGSQTYAVFYFSQQQSGGTTYTLKNADGNPVISYTPANDFTIMIIAGDGLTAGDYTFWQGETQLNGAAGQSFGGGGTMGHMGGDGFQQLETGEDTQMGQMGEGIQPGGMEMPEGGFQEGMEPPEMGDGQMTPPEGMENMDGMEIPEAAEMPDGMEKPEGMEMPEDFDPEEMGEIPEGMGQMTQIPQGGMGMMGQTGETSTTFPIAQGGNYFSFVAPAEEGETTEPTE